MAPPLVAQSLTHPTSIRQLFQGGAGYMISTTLFDAKAAPNPSLLTHDTSGQKAGVPSYKIVPPRILFSRVVGKYEPARLAIGSPEPGCAPALYLSTYDIKSKISEKRQRPSLGTKVDTIKDFLATPLGHYAMIDHKINIGLTILLFMSHYKIPFTQFIGQNYDSDQDMFKAIYLGLERFAPNYASEIKLEEFMTKAEAIIEEFNDIYIWNGSNPIRASAFADKPLSEATESVMYQPTATCTMLFPNHEKYYPSDPIWHGNHTPYVIRYYKHKQSIFSRPAARITIQFKTTTKDGKEVHAANVWASIQLSVNVPGGVSESDEKPRYVNYANSRLIGTEPNGRLKFTNLTSIHLQEADKKWWETVLLLDYGVRMGFAGQGNGASTPYVNTIAMRPSVRSESAEEKLRADDDFLGNFGAATEAGPTDGEAAKPKHDYEDEGEPAQQFNPGWA